MKPMAVKIPVHFIREGKTIVAVCPILDVSAYGDTLEQAKKRFGEALAAFVEETSSHGTLAQVLEEHGWTKVDAPPRWTPPQIIEEEYEEIALPA
jgi:predicted RNase H-like HicB family nuclease